MRDVHLADVAAAKDEIRELLLEFAACLDEHRWDDLPQVFTPGGGIRLPPVDVFRPEALRATAAKNLTRYVVTQHLVESPRIRVLGAIVTVHANVIGTPLIERGEPDRVAIVGGPYDCDVVPTDDGWRMRIVRPTYLWA